ncbi:MAG: SUMF1/EgtB/PvdO family nonheme iron enzyme [Bacteroidales bacterium]|nr:SUMF1/EgtB/PvdO family nonheme iron enzyme [Bacteroidales bacterium]
MKNLLSNVLLSLLICVASVAYGTNSDSEKEKNASHSAQENKAFTVNGVSFVMVYVQGGNYMLGYDSIEPSNHSIDISDYYIGETEVTQGLWKAVMGSNPSEFKGDNLPVENVNIDDVKTFLEKLNQLTGQNFRLPISIEWEYAFRGGNKTNNYEYSGSNDINAVAWCKENSAERTHPVKSKQPNELGIYDMTGNVWEMCYGWNILLYTDHSQITYATKTSTKLVGRGGAWDMAESFCRVSSSSSGKVTRKNKNLGFRLVLSK